MIEIKNLKVSVADKQILNGMSMKFKLGRNYCLLGKNGSWKSTLSAVLAGSPKYEVESWEIEINSKNLLELSPEERSKEGIFLSFQNIPEIPWIKLGEFLRTIYNISKTSPQPSPAGEGVEQKKSEFKWLSPFLFKRFIKPLLEELKIDEEFLERDLNVGFSGWEKRKIEILQMKLIWPKYIILDEIDSGLDLDAFKKVCNMLRKLDSEHNTFIIITHYFKILDYLDINKVFILEDGKIAREGKKALIEEIKESGYEEKDEK